MAFLSSLNIVASGMTAQQLRLDVVAENVTNSTTTRTEAGGPYRRKWWCFSLWLDETTSGRPWPELLAAWRRTLALLPLAASGLRRLWRIPPR